MFIENLPDHNLLELFHLVQNEVNKRDVSSKHLTEHEMDLLDKFGKAQLITVIRSIRDRTKIGLLEAKNRVEQYLNSPKQELEFPINPIN